MTLPTHSKGGGPTQAQRNNDPRSHPLTPPHCKRNAHRLDPPGAQRAKNHRAPPASASARNRALVLTRANKSGPTRAHVYSVAAPV